MQEIKLNRTKLRPLVFMGEEIAGISTKVAGANRWTKVVVYRTAGKLLIAGIANLTCWQGERDYYTAKAFETSDALVKYLETNDPDVASEIAKQLGIAEHIK